MESKTTRKRKKHSEEFKREAVRLMETRGERTIADVAESLGVAKNLLHAWKRKFGSSTEQQRRERGGRDGGGGAQAFAPRGRAAQAGARRPKKIGDLLREGPLVSPYELVQSEKAEFPVGVLCNAVGVSRSAYYAWCRGTPSQRELENQRVLAEIRAIHA